MAIEIRTRRGTTAQHSTFTGADGEVTVDTTKRTLVLHDGVTPGGKPLDDDVNAPPKAAPVDTDTLTIYDSAVAFIKKKVTLAQLRTALSAVLTTAGNLVFTGSAARITGDFSNATVANRVLFQTSTGNSATLVSVIPNGSGTSAGLQLYNSSNPDSGSNSIFDARVIGTTDVRLQSTFQGGGTPLPMTFYAGGAERMRIDSATGVISGGQSQTAQFPPVAFFASESLHATSRRASIGVGGRWTWTQDSNGNGTRDLILYDNTLLRARLSFDTTGNSLHVDPNGGLGYGTGAGGTVTQATSKSTAVTLNKPTGQITMNNAALGAGVAATFSLNNSLIGSADVVLVTPLFGTVNPGNYKVECLYIGVGTAILKVTNTSAGSLSEALQFNFAIIKGATA